VVGVLGRSVRPPPKLEGNTADAPFNSGLGSGEEATFAAIIKIAVGIICTGTGIRTGDGVADAGREMELMGGRDGGGRRKGHRLLKCI